MFKKTNTIKNINRNDNCWCGSENKYKFCHMKSDEILSDLSIKGYPIPDRTLYKSANDIHKIRKSGEITRDILNLLKDVVKEGITTGDIDKFVYDYTIEKGGIPATLNYNGYPKSCCVSLNDVVCHGIPSDRVLKNGDILNIDISTILDGYFSDASNMYTVGEVSQEAKNIIQCANDALQVGLNAVKPFEPVSNIGKSIEAFVTSKGYSVVRDYTGHGIGYEFHEDPYVYHFDANEKGMIMVPGMCFTIEPMVNEGSYKTKLLKDDWTAVTFDGKLSAQCEHTVLVTETGYEILA